MRRLKIRPVIIYHIDIRIHGLHGEKARQPPPAAPAYDQIDPGNIGGFQLLPQQSVLYAKIPIPTENDEEKDLHTALSEASAGRIGQKFSGKYR